MLSFLSHYFSRSTCNSINESARHTVKVASNATDLTHHAHDIVKGVNIVGAALPLSYIGYKGLCAEALGNLPILSVASTIAKHAASPIVSSLISGVAGAVGFLASGFALHPIASFSLFTGGVLYSKGDITSVGDVVINTGKAVLDCAKMVSEIAQSAVHGIAAVSTAISDFTSGNPSLFAELNTDNNVETEIVGDTHSNFATVDYISPFADYAPVDNCLGLLGLDA